MNKAVNVYELISCERDFVVGSVWKQTQLEYSS